MSHQQPNSDSKDPIDFSDIQTHRILGTGELANVYLATHKKTKKTYALKVFDKIHLFEHTAGFDAVQAVIREAQVLEAIGSSSSFVLSMYQSWQDIKNVYFLLPLIQGGELSKRLYDYTTLDDGQTRMIDESATQSKGLPVDHVKFYTACVAEAISYMHQKNIAYRDLKPDNVMIDQDGYCVLIDLGFGKVVQDQTFTMCGTPGYVAPEQMKSGYRGNGVRWGHTKMVDWWSFAVVLYELLATETPFECGGMSEDDVQDAIMAADYKCPSYFPPAAIDLIDSLLLLDATKRLGYAAEAGTSNHAAILQHEWFSTTDFDALRNKTLTAPWVPQLEDDLDTSHFYEYDDEEEAYNPYRLLTETEQKDFEPFPWV